MTIRFTKSWNGYYEGQIVSNPNGGNSEAQLIALGYAVSDLDGPDNSFQLAKFATDSSGNVTGLVGPGGTLLPTSALKRHGSLPRMGKPIVKNPTSVAGVSLSPNVTIAAAVRNGRNCWEVTFPAEATNKSVYWPCTPGVYSDKVSATIEVEDASEWNGGSWRVAMFTDINLTVGMRYVLTVGSGTGWSGFHQIAPKSLEWAAVGGGTWGSTMTYAALQAVRKSSPTGTTRIWIYDFVDAVKNTLPSITIGADDGHGTWYTSGLPVLEKYGFSSYLAYIHDSALAGGSSMTVAQWQDAISRGHHAVIHGCKSGVASLRDYFATYTGYASPYAAMRADIEYNRDGMVANGLDPDGRGRKCYVLPQGHHQPSSGAGDNTILSALTDAGVTTARLAAVVNGFTANGGFQKSRMYLPIIGHSYAGGSEATNISAIITDMQNEVNAGRSVILMLHQIATSPAISEEITAANLELLVSAANTLVEAGVARRGKLTDLADELDTYTAPPY